MRVPSHSDLTQNEGRARLESRAAGQAPVGPGPGELPAGERNLVMHAEIPITGGHVLMATDMLRSMGQETRIGNNTTLCLDVDSREEADRLYGALTHEWQHRMAGISQQRNPSDRPTRARRC